MLSLVLQSSLSKFAVSIIKNPLLLAWINLEICDASYVILISKPTFIFGSGEENLVNVSWASAAENFDNVSNNNSSISSHRDEGKIIYVIL